jgi:HEAT repeat protein
MAKELRLIKHLSYDSIISLVNKAQECIMSLRQTTYMNKRQKDMGKGAAVDNKPNKATLESLIADLGNKDEIIRVKARRRLVGCKARSVPSLIELLTDKNDWVRWEAAKALSQIGNPSSIQALLAALTDKSFEVRWLAAEGLIKIGRKAIIPSLIALENSSDSYWLREGVHHLLHDMNKRKPQKALQPVLKALEGPQPSLEVPLVAKAALDSLNQKID